MKRFALHDLNTIGSDEPNAILEGESLESVAAEAIDANREEWIVQHGHPPVLGVDFELREVE